MMEQPTLIIRGRHPEAEDLLLYQSAELAPEEARIVAGHLAACSQCRERIRRSEAIRVEVAGARAMSGRTLPGRPAVRALPAFVSRHIARGAAAVAAGVCLVFFLTSGTTSARMDAFLSKGAVRETGTPPDPRRVVHLRGRMARCYAFKNASGRVLIGASNEESAQCQQIDAAFQGSGWEWEEALSLKAYRRWRASLNEKVDEIGNEPGLTVASTSTGAGPLLKATLWVRDSDYHTTSGRFEFRSVGAVEVTEVDAPPRPVEPEPPPAGEESHLAFHRPAAPDPGLLERHLDEAELRVRIALRTLDADANFETSVERDETGISVLGVARTQERWQAIDDALRGIAGVRSLVVTEEEAERTQAAVPWMPSFQFTEPALAVKRLHLVFPESAKEQEFSDNVLGLSRRLASYAKAHDELAAVLERSASAADAAAAREAMDALQVRIQSILAELGELLAPFTGPTERTRTVLDAAQALDLYREVYSLIFLSAPDHPGFETGLDRIRGLLGEAGEL